MNFLFYLKSCQKKTLLFSVLLLSISGLSHAQVFTLNQVLDSIKTHNQGLQQYSLQMAANDQNGLATKSWMAPMVGLGVSEFPYNAPMTGNGMMPRKMLMLHLQQVFPNFGQQNKEQAYFQSLDKLDQDDSATLGNLLFAKAKIAYYDAYVAEKKLRVIQQQEKQLNLLVAILQERLKYSKAKLSDIYKARAKLSDLKSLKIQIQSITEQETAILNSLMERPQNASFAVDTAAKMEMLSSFPVQMDSADIASNRSDLLRFSDNINSLSLKKAAVLQQATPTFGLSWDNMSMGNSHYMYSAMATMSIPIAPWFSKGYHAKAKAIDYQIQAMHKMQDNQVSVAIGNIHKAQLKLLAVAQDLELFKTEVIPAYAATYQSYRNDFSENVANIYEMLNAWNDLTNKKLEYWDKVNLLFKSRVLLEAALQHP